VRLELASLNTSNQSRNFTPDSMAHSLHIFLGRIRDDGGTVQQQVVPPAERGTMTIKGAPGIDFTADQKPGGKTKSSKRKSKADRTTGGFLQDIKI
jgi:hypothetical protein